MLDNIFQGIFDTAQTETIAPSEFLILIAASLVVGLILAAAYKFYLYLSARKSSPPLFKSTVVVELCIKRI